MKQIQELYKKNKLKSRTRLPNNKLKSPVWGIFHELFDENSNIVRFYYLCTVCKQIESCRPNQPNHIYEKNRNVGTHPLLRHKCYLLHVNKKEISTTKITKFLSGSVKIAEDDINFSKKAVCEFIAADVRPVYAVEGVGFKNVCMAFFELGQKYSQNNIEGSLEKLLPSRSTVNNISAFIYFSIYIQKNIVLLLL